MTLKKMIKGKSKGGYFGNAIVSLGDMDGDSKDGKWTKYDNKNLFPYNITEKQRIYGRL